MVVLEDNLLVPEYSEIGASWVASPVAAGSCIAGIPVTREIAVGSAADVKECSCAHVDAEAALEGKDRLDPEWVTLPARPQFAVCT